MTNVVELREAWQDGPPADRFADESSTDASTSLPPPHDAGAEQSVLSAVLVKDSVLLVVIDFLRSEHFFSEAHRQIFAAILGLHAEGTPIDVVTTASRLQDAGRLKQVGGNEYLIEVLDAAPALKPVSVAAYGRRVVELWQRRQLLFVSKVKAAELELGRISASDYRDELARAAEAIAPTTPAKSIETFGVADIFAPLPAIDWRVEGLKLAPGAAAAFVGYGYTAKSLSVQSLGVSCASGRPAFGVYRVDACRVLHLDYEQGRRLTFERYQRLALGMGIVASELADRLRVAVMPSVYLDSASASDIYARAFEGFGLVIVDSLRAAAPSADENSSEVRRYIDVLTRAGEMTGALPVFLHHARKPSEHAKGGAKMSIRGSSAIFDACASVFVFEAEKGEPTRVHHEKERITGAALPDFGLQVEDVAIAGNARAGLRIVHMELEQLAPARPEDKARRDAETIRSFFRKNGAHFAGSKDALRGRVGIGQARFYAALSTMGDELLSERIGGLASLRWKGCTP